jgi:hypothetical protein
MNWLSMLVIAYLGPVVVELTWTRFAMLRFKRNERRRAIVLRSPSSTQMGIYSAMGQFPWESPKQTPANLSIHPRNLRFEVCACERSECSQNFHRVTGFNEPFVALFPVAVRRDASPFTWRMAAMLGSHFILRQAEPTSEDVGPGNLMMLAMTPSNPAISIDVDDRRSDYMFPHSRVVDQLEWQQRLRGLSPWTHALIPALAAAAAMAAAALYLRASDRRF